MSLGSSLKFNVASDNGKPAILWQQDKQQKKPRKFGYKNKDLQHPVRKTDNENYHNNKKNEIQNIQKKEEKKVRRTDFIKKNKEKYKDNQKNDSKNDPSGKSTVTLTQDQLNAILESVGKLASGKDSSLRISIDNELHEVKIEKPEEFQSKELKSNDSEDTKVEVSENTDAKTTGDSETEKKGSVNSNTATSDNTSKPESDVRLPPPIPWAHLTLLEKKRLQWAQERGEVSQTYNPWGRPGAGAPIRGETGQVIADLRNKEEIRNAVIQNVSKPEVSHQPPRENVSGMGFMSDKAADSNMHTDSLLDKVPPAAMRSSLVIGHVAPDENRYNTSKEQEKKRWLEELEKQREEQRRKKLLSRERQREAPPPETNKEEHRLPMNSSPRMAVFPADSEKILPVGGTGIALDSKYSKMSEEEKKQYLKDLERQIQLQNQKKIKELWEHNTDPQSRTVIQGKLKTNRTDEKKLPWQTKKEDLRTEKFNSLNKGTILPFGQYDNEYSVANEKRKKQQQYLRDLEKQIEEQNQKKINELRENYKCDNWPNKTAEKETQHFTKFPGNVENTGRKGQSRMPFGVSSHTDSFLPPNFPGNNNGRTLKEEAKKQYVKDLEMQIELHNQKKLIELQESAAPDHWADRFVHLPGNPSPAQISHHIPAPQVPGFQNHTAGESTTRTSSAPQPVLAVDADEASKHLRGQHIVLDPITQRELEEKKKRQREYQEAVKQQIQEKQRQKQLERERKMMEEQEEEMRLQKEREALMKQFEDEQNKLKSKEEARQHQIDVLKNAMDEAKERAQREKTLRRLQWLEQGGHDVSRLKAQLQMSSGSLTDLDLSFRSGAITEIVPTLPNISARNSERPPDPNAQESYVTDRVITPNVYRQRNQGQGSPRRDFGTQTQNGTVAPSSNMNLDLTDVYVVYSEPVPPKPEVPTRKVQSLPAKQEMDRNENKKRSHKERQKPGEVKWNYQNRQKKKAVKQSEKDPFYEEKQEELEERRAQRKQKLLALVEANKQMIPADKHRVGENPQEVSDHDMNKSNKNNKRATKSDTNSSPIMTDTYTRGRSKAQSQKVHKSSSEERPSLPLLDPQSNHHRPLSPPVPALKHRMVSEPDQQVEILKISHENDYTMDHFNYTNYPSQENPPFNPAATDHYTDSSTDLVINNTDDVIPFTRTSDILDPSKACDPIQVSRENTRIRKARKAYIENQAPGCYGSKADYVQESSRNSPVKDRNNPLTNPCLLTDHPTVRQEMILKQLSTLKQSLRQRQRELETCMSPSDFDSGI